VATHDAIVQTPPQLDPTQWTGNQRVVHFGPMAQRDPFYYYYPKGWDILYPAHFGFFPYRTNKFRGSSPTVCLSAFGIFFSIGGVIMTYLGYAVLPSTSNMDEEAGQEKKPFKLTNPLQIAGPVLLILGAISLIAGAMWWLCSLNLCSEHLRHTQPHHASPRKKYVQSSRYEHPMPYRSVIAKSPYSPPPPPPIPVLENVHTETSLYKQRGEMKLFPPVIPGATSTLSLARNTPQTGSAYATMSGRGTNRSRGTVYENMPDVPYRT